MPKIDLKDNCIACLGIGKSTKGSVCPICNGSGKRRTYDAQTLETRTTSTSQHTKTSKSSKPKNNNGN